MTFNKKIVILKQITEGYSLSGKSVCGILRLEFEGGVCEMHLSAINFLPVQNGVYKLFLVDGDKNVYINDLGKHPCSFNKVLDCDIPLDKSVVGGICIVNSDLPVTVAFGCSENCNLSATDFKKIVADKCLNDRKDQKRQMVSQIDSQAIKMQNDYNDEAVATENYYQIEQDISEKLDTIKGFDNERIPDEDGLSFVRDEKETQKNQEDVDFVQDEKDAYDGKEFSQANPYYLTVKEDLEEIFIKFPEEDCLPRYFFGSRWAKIYYSKSKYYVVGVIKENDKEKYICYGVPSAYSEQPPKELKGYCTFIPISIFDMKGDGYWMMFQDAVLGTCVKPTRT